MVISKWEKFNSFPSTTSYFYMHDIPRIRGIRKENFNERLSKLEENFWFQEFFRNGIRAQYAQIFQILFHFRETKTPSKLKRIIH